VTTNASSSSNDQPSNDPVGPPLGLGGRLLVLWRRWRIRQRLGMGLIIAAVVSAILTYAVFTGSVPFLPASPSVLLALLNLDLVLFLAVVIMIARRVVRLWGQRRRGMAGSGLHVRLVVLFSLVAGLPTVLVTTSSVVFLHFGLQGWFSQQIDKALDDSLTVADAYLKEHSRAVARDALAVAADLRRDAGEVGTEEGALTAFLERHLRWRGLQAAIVFSANGKVDSRAGDLSSMAKEVVPDWAIADGRKGEVAVVIGRDGDQLRGLVKLDGEPERFLYVGRAVDQEVLRYVGDIRAAVRRFKNLQAERADIELTFGVIFAMLALLLVMSAIWFGLSFASRLASPIAALVEGAERVRAGDLEVQLAEMGELGEFQTLGRTFNSMTTQLRAQRQELVEANRQVDQRRRFTEAVLAGVAAGVVGLDPEGRIRYPNRMAGELLGIDLEQHRDTPLADLLPEVGPLIERAHRSFAATTEGQITHTTADGVHTFLVRVTVETGGDAGSVATFTDITDLLDAQRKAAWSDIARRIAHEIKNPLTPIQLSAERLKRRYLPQITDDPQTFQLCTDTIIRQVDGLRQLVDEFSNFARLPAPRMEPVDLTDIAREGISLQQIAFADVTFSLEGANEPMQIVADAGQLGRVLTNLLQNAAEAIERRLENEGPESEPGMVTLALKRDGDMAVIAISDNGAGLPGHLRDRLADPYVTTRAKGTGLGLAIVQKIANDHGGSLQFQDRPGGGAEVIVTIAVAPQAQGQTHGA
jgi:two-component system, NtrC family, nitrogen regulation sensor histidine kinase NtrY